MNTLIAKLVVISEPDSRLLPSAHEPLSERTFPLNPTVPTTIGRDPSLVDIVLPARSVSRVHAQIVLDEQSSKIENLSDSKPLLVNRVRLRPGERMTLSDGAWIEIGGYSIEFQAPFRIPHYELLEELGHGGMGLVYKARNIDSNQIVAIKVVLAGRGASFEARARFRIEAEALACLDHPNIVKIRDVGVYAGYPYFAIDYAERGSLLTRISRCPQDPRWAAALLRDLARAMQHAHDRSILHRDLKPANILLMADETPMISDFGLVKFTLDVVQTSLRSQTFSIGKHLTDEEVYRWLPESRPAQNDPFPKSDPKGDEDEVLAHMLRHFASTTGLIENDDRLGAIREFLDESGCRDGDRRPFALLRIPVLTQAGVVMGSPQYMAPEQARADAGAIGPRTDVYGLGGILFEMLTGAPLSRTYPVGFASCSKGSLQSHRVRLGASNPAFLARLKRSVLSAWRRTRINGMTAQALSLTTWSDSLAVSPRRHSSLSQQTVVIPQSRWRCPRRRTVRLKRICRRTIHEPELPRISFEFR